MYTNIKDIANSLGLDEKIVAKIYKEGFNKGLDARWLDLPIGEINKEIDNFIY